MSICRTLHAGRMLLVGALGAVSASVLLIDAGAAAQQRQAQLSWWDRADEQQMGHYWVKTDLPADEIRPLAQRLNVLYDQYSLRMAHLPVRVEENLNVFVFKRQRDYEFTLRARFGLDAAGSGGMFFKTPVGGGLAFFTEDLPMQRICHVMQHEGFHQFAWSRFADDLPVWVNEGMAEFFGESVVVGETLVIGQSNPRVLDSIKHAIAEDRTFPFERMLTMGPREWAAALKDPGNRDRAALQYQQAWSMVHFLVYGDGGKYVENFETYLRHLNNGLPPREAFVRSFGDDIAGFERRWRTYALNARPSAFVSAMEKIEFLAEGAVELSKQRKYPDSLDALKAALRAIKFTQTIRTHGIDVTLSADDDAMFEIPRDDLNKQDEHPGFIVNKAKPARMSVQQRKLEDANPTPPTIGTGQVRPRNMQVRWIRDEKKNEWRYEIEVK